jgi:hypothetical protein
VAHVEASTDAAAVAREAVRGFSAASVNALGGNARGRGTADDDASSASGDADLGGFLAESGGEAVPFALGTAAGAGRTQATGGAAAALRADVAGRMERVLAIQEAVAEQPLSHVSVRLDGDDGTATRVHVGMRGSMVGASIDTADPLSAASMRAHVAELRQALEQQGLDPSALLVRAAGKSTESMDASRLLASLAKADPTLATLTTGSARESSQQRDSASQGQSHHQPARRDADAQRQRQSRNGKEDRP